MMHACDKPEKLLSDFVVWTIKKFINRNETDEYFPISPQSCSRPLLGILWSRLTRSACSGRTWARSFCGSVCRSSAWRTSVSACGRAGWSGRRTLCHSGHRRTVSLQCETSCGPAGATVDWRLCRTPCIRASGHGLACAWPALAWTRTPCGRWDTSWPAGCPGSGEFACVCSDWKMWRKTCRTRRKRGALWISLWLGCSLQSLHPRCCPTDCLPCGDTSGWTSAGSVHQRWGRHRWCMPPAQGRYCLTQLCCWRRGCPDAPCHGRRILPQRCRLGSTGALRKAQSAHDLAPLCSATLRGWCNHGCSL